MSTPYAFVADDNDVRRAMGPSAVASQPAKPFGAVATPFAKAQPTAAPQAAPVATQPAASAARPAQPVVAATPIRTQPANAAPAQQPATKQPASAIPPSTTQHLAPGALPGSVSTPSNAPQGRTLPVQPAQPAVQTAPVPAAATPAAARAPYSGLADSGAGVGTPAPAASARTSQQNAPVAPNLAAPGSVPRGTTLPSAATAYAEDEAARGGVLHVGHHSHAPSVTSHSQHPVSEHDHARERYLEEKEQRLEAEAERLATIAVALQADYKKLQRQVRATQRAEREARLRVRQEDDRAAAHEKLVMNRSKELNRQRVALIREEERTLQRLHQSQQAQQAQLSARSHNSTMNRSYDLNADNQLITTMENAREEAAQGVPHYSVPPKSPPSHRSMTGLPLDAAGNPIIRIKRRKPVEDAPPQEKDRNSRKRVLGAARSSYEPPAPAVYRVDLHAFAQDLDRQRRNGTGHDGDAETNRSATSSQRGYSRGANGEHSPRVVSVALNDEDLDDEEDDQVNSYAAIHRRSQNGSHNDELNRSGGHSERSDRSRRSAAGSQQQSHRAPAKPLDPDLIPVVHAPGEGPLIDRGAVAPRTTAGSYARSYRDTQTKRASQPAPTNVYGRPATASHGHAGHAHGGGSYAQQNKNKRAPAARPSTAPQASSNGRPAAAAPAPGSPDSDLAPDTDFRPDNAQWALTPGADGHGPELAGASGDEADEALDRYLKDLTQMKRERQDRDANKRSISGTTATAPDFATEDSYTGTPSTATNSKTSLVDLAQLDTASRGAPAPAPAAGLAPAAKSAAGGASLGASVGNASVVTVDITLSDDGDDEPTPARSTAPPPAAVTTTTVPPAGAAVPSYASTPSTTRAHSAAYASSPVVAGRTVDSDGGDDEPVLVSRAPAPAPQPAPAAAPSVSSPVTGRPNDSLSSNEPASPDLSRIERRESVMPQSPPTARATAPAPVPMVVSAEPPRSAPTVAPAAAPAAPTASLPDSDDDTDVRVPPPVTATVDKAEPITRTAPAEVAPASPAASRAAPAPATPADSDASPNKSLTRNESLDRSRSGSRRRYSSSSDEAVHSYTMKYSAKK